MVPFGLNGVLESSRPDVVDEPALPEGLPDLLLRDPLRERVFAGVPVTEAEHEVLPAGFESGCETLCKGGPVFVGEDMEEAGIDDGIKHPPETGEVQRVPDKELRLEPPGRRDLLYADDTLHALVDDPHGQVERDMLGLEEAGEPHGSAVQTPCNPEHLPCLPSRRHPVHRDWDFLPEDDHGPGGQEELQLRGPVRVGEGLDENHLFLHCLNLDEVAAGVVKDRYGHLINNVCWLHCERYTVFF